MGKGRKGYRFNWEDWHIREAIRAAIDAGSEEAAERVWKRAVTSNEFADSGESKKEWATLRKTIDVKKSKFEHGGHLVTASAPHANLVEYGHNMVVGGSMPGRKATKIERSGTGRIVGHVAPRPFLRNALKAEKKNAERIIMDKVKDAIR